MKEALAELNAISELLAEDSEAALFELKAFKLRQRNTKNAFVTAKANLLTLTIGSVFNQFEEQGIDDQKLLRYFEAGKHFDEAAQLLLAKARHFFMNGKLAEGEALLSQIQNKFLDKISLRSEIVYLTRIAFVHGRHSQFDEMARASMLGLQKLKDYEPKNTWYYSIYTIFCTNIAECYHSNADFEKSWPYLQQSIEIAETKNIPAYNKYNVYSYVAFYYEYKDEYLTAAQWLEKIVALLHNKPSHAYYEIHSRIAAARQYAQLIRNTPGLSKALQKEYIKKQHELLNNVKERIKADDGNYLAMLMALADLEYQQGSYKKAAFYIEKSLGIYTSRKHTKGIADCYALAHQIYYALGKNTGNLKTITKAYDYLKISSDMLAAQTKRTNLEKIEAIEAKRQLENKNASKLLMQQQIESINKELRLNAINLQEKIALLNDIKSYINSLKRKRVEKNEFIKAISQKIGATKVTEQDKALLQQKLDEGNAGLFRILAETYPALTPREVRSCALIKTGLTDKELSKLYGLGERGYEQLRYRIKRKMKLKRADNLVKHLMDLDAKAGNL